MLHRFDYDQAVRVIRSIRDDGSYPGKQRGDLLVSCGAIGHVVDVGTFLQDQVIYRVHFIDQGVQVGCREEELIGVEEPWHPSRFEFRQWVTSNRKLAVKGQIMVEPGDRGQVMKTLKQTDQETQYQVRFPDHTLQLRESVLEPCPGVEAKPEMLEPQPQNQELQEQEQP